MSNGNYAKPITPFGERQHGVVRSFAQAEFVVEQRLINDCGVIELIRKGVEIGSGEVLTHVIRLRIIEGMTKEELNERDNLVILKDVIVTKKDMLGLIAESEKTTITKVDAARLVYELRKAYNREYNNVVNC